MEILRSIALYTESRDMPFLLIGGHAINAYGFSRNTGDLDLLICRDAKDDWTQLLERLQYEGGQNDSRFARFRPKNLDNWPIDLMLVDSETFQKMLTESTEQEFAGIQIKVISPEHLVILKIHALKHFQEHRFTKDYNDLINILRSKLVDLSLEEIQKICQRYATEELFLKIRGDINDER